MSQGITESVDRRRRLQEEIGLAAEGQTITNTEMMNIWGVTKGRWSDVRNRMPDFPIPVTSAGVQLYPRQAALAKMWEWETRNDKTDADKATRLAALLGTDDFTGSLPSMSEMMKASQLRADAEARMVRQGQLVLASDNRRLWAEVFELLSRRLSSLGTILDPNGAWPQELRDGADEAGSGLLLAVHGKIKDILGHNVAAEPTRDRGDLPGSVEPIAARAPRKARGRSPKPA